MSASCLQQRDQQRDQVHDVAGAGYPHSSDRPELVGQRRRCPDPAQSWQGSAINRGGRRDQESCASIEIDGGAAEDICRPRLQGEQGVSGISVHSQNVRAAAGRARNPAGRSRRQTAVAASAWGWICTDGPERQVAARGMARAGADGAPGWPVVDHASEDDRLSRAGEPRGRRGRPAGARLELDHYHSAAAGRRQGGGAGW